MARARQASQPVPSAPRRAMLVEDKEVIDMMRTRMLTTAGPGTIWIDHKQAIIAIEGVAGGRAVERIGRGTRESEAAFHARAVDAVALCSPLVVSGPAFARTAFERAYTAVTHRPERLVDVEPAMDADDAADLPARR